MRTKEFRKQVEAYIRERLSQRGFKPKGGAYIIEVQPEILGFSSVGTVTHRGDGLIGYAPLVGIESIRMRKELNRLEGEKPNRRQASLTIMLGYLMPEKRFLEWLMNPLESIDQRREMEQMCRAIELYGMPFMREFGSMNAIAHSLETMQYSYRERVLFHLPVAYRLLGQEEKARELVTRSLVEMTARKDILATDFQSFAQRFLEPMDAERGSSRC